MWYFRLLVTLAYNMHLRLMVIQTIHSFVFSLAMYARASKLPSGVRVSQQGNTGEASHVRRQLVHLNCASTLVRLCI